MRIDNFEGRTIAPGDADYDTARFGWNGMIDRKPALIAKCNSVADVVAAVRHAAANRLIAVARCGGHSVSGASVPEGGVVIDLARLNQVDVDPQQRIAHVGGGALLGDLDAATQQHALAVTAGVDPGTGAGGLTLGGGIGFLARKLGLTIDNLLGAQVVLADGSVVEANKSSHPDLFWALRGGGGQFGIVTRFDLALHPVGPEVMVASAFYPVGKARQIMRFIDGYARAAPDELGLVAVFGKVPPAEPFPAAWHGKYTVALVASHVGETDTARKALQPLVELGELIFGFVGAQPYVQFQRSFAEANPDGVRYYWKSVFVEKMSEALIDVLAKGIQDLPGEHSTIFIEVLGGAVARVGATDTAFANRQAHYNLGIAPGWIDPALDAAAIARVRSLFDQIAPLSAGGVYLNYVDRDESARASEAFGPNVARLRAVKAKYDPDNLFSGPLGGAS